MRIIGIDPALRNIGWAIIEKNVKNIFIDSGTIKTNNNESLEDRIFTIHQQLTLIINKFSPNIAAIEETIINNNGQSSLLLSQARGAILLSLKINSLQIKTYTPTEVKKIITGSGKADKFQLQKMLKFLLPNAKYDSFDASDAIAIALCDSIKK